MNNIFEALTFTTFGYKDYTDNLLKSISINQVDINLNVYALDEKSKEYFNDTHNNVTTLETEVNFEKFIDQKNSRFGELMYKKFECIHNSMTNNEYVLYVDSDVVIKKNITNYLLRNIKSNDILFQNDKNPKKPNQINVCAGFMFIKSNRKNLNFFNPKNIPIEKIINYRTHDQTHINKSLAKFNYAQLPLREFANGPYFYKNFENLNPAMIHFNYVLGNEKIACMKKYEEWYL